MACLERETIEGYQSIGKSICDFLYIDGRGRNGFKSHSVEEYQNFLQELARNSFDTYNEAAKEMGWIE